MRTGTLSFKRAVQGLGVLLYWLWSACAFADGLVLQRGQSFYEPYPQLRYFCTAPARTPTAEQVLATPQDWPWAPVGQSALTRFTHDICWFHLTVRNQDHPARDWILAIPFPFLLFVQVHIQDEQGRLLADYRAGHVLPVSIRPIPDRNLIFPLTLPPSSPRDIFLRVQGDHMQVPLELSERQLFETQAHIRNLVQGVFFGGMLVMIFYNLVLWFFIRDRVYLLYVLMVAATTLFQFDQQGFSKLYLWPETTVFARYTIRIELTLLLIFYSLFVLGFLELRQRAPAWAWSLRLLIGAGVMLLLAIPLLEGLITTPITLGFLFLLTIVGLLIGLDRMAAGDPEARIFTLAWGCLIVGSILIMLNKFGILPRNPLTENLLQLGSFLEVVLMSMALAARINRLKDAQVKAEQGQAIAQLQAQQAEQHSLAKGEFLAKMSHEIRTPMNAVLGFAQLMRDTALTPTQRNYMETLFNSGETLLTVINE